jgi:hypothetical protein
MYGDWQLNDVEHTLNTVSKELSQLRQEEEERARAWPTPTAAPPPAAAGLSGFSYGMGGDEARGVYAQECGGPPPPPPPLRRTHKQQRHWNGSTNPTSKSLASRVSRATAEDRQRREAFQRRGVAAGVAVWEQARTQRNAAERLAVPAAHRDVRNYKAATDRSRRAVRCLADVRWGPVQAEARRHCHRRRRHSEPGLVIFEPSSCEPGVHPRAEWGVRSPRSTAHKPAAKHGAGRWDPALQVPTDGWKYLPDHGAGQREEVARVAALEAGLRYGLPGTAQRYALDAVQMPPLAALKQLHWHLDRTALQVGVHGSILCTASCRQPWLTQMSAQRQLCIPLHLSQIMVCGASVQRVELEEQMFEMHERERLLHRETDALLLSRACRAWPERAGWPVGQQLYVCGV